MSNQALGTRPRTAPRPETRMRPWRKHDLAPRNKAVGSLSTARPGWRDRAAAGTTEAPPETGGRCASASQLCLVPVCGKNLV
jgi:hypothetical protein